MEGPFSGAPTVTFGEHLRSLRVARGLTQQGLADQIGASLVHVNRIEMGHSWPSFPMLDRLTKALDCNPYVDWWVRYRGTAGRRIQ